MTRHLTPFPVVCSCGRLYSERQWSALPLVGYQEDDEETLEQRNCTSCESTRSVPVNRQSEIELTPAERRKLIKRLVDATEPILSHEKDTRPADA